MLHSMTGFGASECTTQSHRVKIEIRTLNSKFLDLNLRLPHELSDKEVEIRNLINASLKRGKVNFNIEIEAQDQLEPTVTINKELFKSYYSTYEAMAKSCEANTDELFKLALQSPDVVITESSNEFDEWAKVRETLVQAINKCVAFRSQEGESLRSKLEGYVSKIRAGLNEVKKRDPQRIAQIRQRIDQSINEIRERVQVDQNRFEQELIYYIEKLDITEEKVRLSGHLDYFMEVLSSNESEGKKLGFITQEIGREINTIGSKANDAEIQRAVVQMKDELEKIKEQTLNIL